MRVRFSPMASAASVACMILVFQWLLVSRFQVGMEQGDVGRILLSLLGVGAAVGLCAGILTIIARRRPSESAAVHPVAFALALLAFLETFEVAQGAGPTARVALAASPALLVFLGAAYLARHLPDRVLHAELWWMIAGVGIVSCLALTLPFAVDGVGMAIALVGATAALCLLLRGFLISGSGIVHTALALSILVAATIWIGFRTPYYVVVDAAPPSRPSVLLITMDTLRVDHVGAYGYAAARTPNLDELASAGVLFEKAVATSFLTGPSHVSILTGLYPEQHGVLTNGVRLTGSSTPTLADLLRAEGYVTAAFVSSFTTQDVASGLPSRFDSHDDNIRNVLWIPTMAETVPVVRLLRQVLRALGPDVGARSRPYRVAGDTVDSAVRWLDVNGKRPFFIWVHLFDPHTPYWPRKRLLAGRDMEAEDLTTHQWISPGASDDLVDNPENIERMISLYDSEIAYVDEQIGRLVSAARSASVEGNLAIIATSDHGEAHGEHGLFWHRDLYDQSVLVPLLVQPPPQDSRKSGHRVSDQVSLADLAPTILDLVVAATRGDFDGASLVPLMSGDGHRVSAPAFTQVHPHQEGGRVLHAVREKGWKLIRRYSGRDGGEPVRFFGVSHELYDLADDPRELINLQDTDPAELARLGALLDAKPPAMKLPGFNLSPEQLQHFRSLGYIR